MNNDRDVNTEEIIDAVTKRSGLSRSIVELVVDNIRSVVAIPNIASTAPTIQARILPEIRFELTANNTLSPSVDRQKLATNRSKIGGSAEWIHDPRTPVCCGKLATFYAQIDTNLGPEISIVDAGVLYVFVCDECSAAFTELQYH